MSSSHTETFKRALAINPRQIDLRLRMVRLQICGTAEEPPGRAGAFGP